MAIDTAAKRARAAAFSARIPILPMPDGTIDATDRAWLLMLYYAATSILITTIDTSDDRTVIIPAQNRTVEIQSQNRTITIK